MARRTSLATLAGGKVDKVPGASDPLLLTLPLSKLVPTRFNPRRNFGTDEDLQEFGLVLKHRQLQPAVVVSRAGYLKLWPEEEENLGDASYVIANGERRFRASLAIGLTTLNVVHDENVAASRADFLDAVLSENNDRKDLDPIEQALGIETMVEQLKGADPVAEHFGKTKGWVSQQRKLLKLTPALQDLVSAKEMPVREAREIAGLPPEEQGPAWEAKLHQRQTAAAAPKARRAPAPRTEAPKQTERFTAVNQNSSGGAPDPKSSVQEVVTPVTETVTQALPSARTGPENTEEQAAPAGGPGPDEAEPEALQDDAESSAGPSEGAPEPLPDMMTTGAVPWRNVPVVLAILKRWMTPEDYELLYLEMSEEIASSSL